MSSMPADAEQEEATVYEFVAAGENTCERCMALSHSTWREPPNPPHAHCECEIVPHKKGVHRPRDCGDTTWSIEHIPQSGTVVYGPAADYGWEWGFKVTIDCWDGGTYEFEIWVDMGYDRDWPPTVEAFDAMDAYAWSEIYDEAEAVAARVCRPCNPPLVS